MSPAATSRATSTDCVSRCSKSPMPFWASLRFPKRAHRNRSTRPRHRVRRNASHCRGACHDRRYAHGNDSPPISFRRPERQQLHCPVGRHAGKRRPGAGRCHQCQVQSDSAGTQCYQCGTCRSGIYRVILSKRPASLRTKHSKSLRRRWRQQYQV